MAVEDRIAKLNKDHAQLEQHLTDELSHPSSDDNVITELKLKKLRIKEEIQRLRREPA